MVNSIIGTVKNGNTEMNNMDEIVNQMKPDDLREILVGGTNLMLEGGHMPFVDRNGNPLSVQRINQENVAATLKYIYDEILPAIQIDRKWVQPLGSTGKKLAGGSSGDIDLGIDATKISYLMDA